MYVLNLPSGEMFGGADALIRMSVIIAQVGRDGEKFRYDFSHIISMTSFLALTLSRFSPPSSRGSSNMPGAMRGVFSPSHMNSWISFWIAFSKCGCLAKTTLPAAYIIRQVMNM